MTKHHDVMVKHKQFNIGDLILKKLSLATKDPVHGKLGPNWEGPYKVINSKRWELYYLDALDGQKLEHPWNVEHLGSNINEDSLRRSVWMTLTPITYVF